jgi:hypothetical protein
MAMIRAAIAQIDFREWPAPWGTLSFLVCSVRDSGVIEAKKAADVYTR